MQIFDNIFVHNWAAHNGTPISIIANYKYDTQQMPKLKKTNFKCANVSS